jgi:hypothetical protein
LALTTSPRMNVFGTCFPEPSSSKVSRNSAKASCNLCCSSSSCVKVAIYKAIPVSSFAKNTFFFLISLSIL